MHTNFRYFRPFSDFLYSKKFFSTLIHQNTWIIKGVHFRLVNQNTLSALDEILALTNIDDIISNVNINEATQLLFDRINNSFKLCCPKILSLKHATKPWISGEICVNIKKRQNYYSLVRQNKMSHQFYARFRNFLTNQIKQPKINYFARKFQQLKEDLKSTWKQINSIIRPLHYWISFSFHSQLLMFWVIFSIFHYVLVFFQIV